MSANALQKARCKRVSGGLVWHVYLKIQHRRASRGSICSFSRRVGMTYLPEELTWRVSSGSIWALLFAL